MKSLINKIAILAEIDEKSIIQKAIHNSDRDYGLCYNDTCLKIVEPYGYLGKIMHCRNCQQFTCRDHINTFDCQETRCNVCENCHIVCKICRVNYRCNWCKQKLK